MYKSILPAAGSSAAGSQPSDARPLLDRDRDSDAASDSEDTDAGRLSESSDAMDLKPTVSVQPSSGPGDDNHGRDAAADLLRRIGAADQDDLAVTPAEEARVLRRIDWRIMPLILTVYFLQGLDKATLSYAAVFGLIDDTGLQGNQFSWLGSVVYIAQLVLQHPIAWLLVKLPLGKFISVMVLFWGITLAGMTAAHNFPTLLTARFFLGAFEASVAPTFVAVTQMWWRRREQTMRVSSWYSMNGITSMVSSPTS